MRPACGITALLLIGPVYLCVGPAANASGPDAANGRTFYVDFEGGSDSADGLSATSAFKRSPGDPAAHQVTHSGNRDYHLKGGSPAVDGGTDAGALYPKAVFPGFDFDKDLDGRPRKQGAAVDIGPYESSPK